jgi:hypothetical protein
LLRRGLAGTADLFPVVRTGFGWVRRVAHLLGRQDLSGAQVRRGLRVLLGRMRAEANRPEVRGDTELAKGLRHFVKVSGSYEPGLLHAYDVPDLPRTNNDLEYLFGSHRYHEWRASGRKVASPGLVVRGSVRLVADLATRLQSARGADLAPADLAAWRRLHQGLQRRRGARVLQRLFRRDPKAYLEQFKDMAIQLTMPTQLFTPIRNINRTGRFGQRKCPVGTTIVLPCSPPHRAGGHRPPG